MLNGKRHQVFKLVLFAGAILLLILPSTLSSCGTVVDLDLNSGRVRSTDRFLGIPTARRVHASFVSERVTTDAPAEWARVYRDVQFGRRCSRIDAPRFEMFELKRLAEAGVLNEDASRVAAVWLLEQWRDDLFDPGRRRYLLELEIEAMTSGSGFGPVPVSGDRIAAYLAAYATGGGVRVRMVPPCDTTPSAPQISRSPRSGSAAGPWAGRTGRSRTASPSAGRM